MIRVLLLQRRRPDGRGWPSLLDAHPDVSIVGTAATLKDARTLLARDDYEAVFLDPRLAGGRALELLPRIRTNACVVFTPAPDDVAARVFEAAGADVLIPPVEPGSLAKLLDRLRMVTAAPPRFIPVRIGTVDRLLRVGDIGIVVACENYTAATLVSGERVLVRRTMRQWAADLPAADFARVHRGLLVNLARIARVASGPGRPVQLLFAGGSPPAITMKRRHWPVFRGKLESWRVMSRPGSFPGVTSRSVAVLPFANLSLDPENEVFCDGICEELMNVLAKVPGLHVAARTSAFHFKGRHLPIPDIARQLGVDAVVEGSVRRSGGRLRLTAQLINAADGFHLWSENFERELGDVFAVQDEIAGEIAANLRLSIDGPVRRAAVDPEAHRLTLEGRHFWNLRTEDGFRRAEAAFTRAVTLDPRFAPAHAGLADVCNIRALYRLADGAAGATDDLPRARAAAGTALRLDPSLAEAHATLGFIAFHEGRLEQARRAFTRAFAINPNYAPAYQFHAWTLCACGQLERALDEFAKAIALDPLSFISLDRHAAMLALAGRFAEALAVNERAAALRPDVFVGNLAQRSPLLLALGRRAEAIGAARSVRVSDSRLPYRRNADSDAIFVLQQTGCTAEAADYAAEVLARLEPGNYLRGFVLAAIGRVDEAIDGLGRPPTIMLPFLYWSSLWDPARDRPAFRALFDRLDCSEEYGRARMMNRRTPVSVMNLAPTAEAKRTLACAARRDTGAFPPA